jgi:hypothetical protein
MCSGCVRYVDAPSSSKLRGNREETHTSYKTACQQPWLKEGTDYYGSSRFQEIEEFLFQNHGISAGRLEAVRATPTPTAIPLPSQHDDDGVSPLTGPGTEASSSTTTSESTRSDGRKSKKERGDIELYTTIISSNGHDFQIDDVPITHCIITKARLEGLRKSSHILKKLQKGCQNSRFAGGSSLMRSLIAIAVTSCPALPLSQAANVIPMFVAGVLVDFGVLDRAEVQGFSTSFPSETYLRDLVFMFAAENMYQLGVKVVGIQVFLSCDKGNKKGVGHFVKILSWYDDKTKSVVKQLLDIDASEGLTDDCGDAIAASLKKIGNIKLQGQTTDSGGGGVLDGLHRAIEERLLVRPGYLVASCGLHNLQLSIANPIKQTMGEGGLEKKNVMQLLHSVYDLQESMDRDVWKMHVKEATAFLDDFGNSDTPYIGVSNGDCQFATKWELVKAFRQFDAMNNKETKWVNFKIPAPVLTRWWTVGETAKVSWSAYLLLLRISQQVINSTSSKPNKIASGLQPLLLELELFSDLAWVNCFHSYYASPHFDWMQSATDLSAVEGFQAHNTAARYFLLVQDLTALDATTSDMACTHAAFVEFQSTLDKCSPSLRQHQLMKAKKFVTVSLEAIHKHFARWCNKMLLPAALLSESPLSIVVASILLKKQDLPQDVAVEFASKVHFHNFHIPSFNAFLRSKVSPTDDYPPLALHAAQLLLDGLDLRNMHDDAYRGFKEYLYYNYLPLASQTQFVEAGVKEAKNVSPTDRSEMLRSAYAVSRSARVHCIDDLRCLKSTERIEALINSALLHDDEQQQQLKSANPDYYYERITAIAKSMREDHFKQERLLKMKTAALRKVNKNKTENALQQKTGVDRTHTSQGLFPYGKLVKRLHFDALKVELLFRGCCSEEEINDLTITQRKNRLKELEIERLEDFDAAAKDMATRAFKPLSGALFPAS